MQRQGANSSMPSEKLDARVVQTFEKRFEEVETIFNDNSSLIREISKNQQNLGSEASLIGNAVLFRQLNANIGQVVQLYSDMSKQYCKALQNDQNTKSRACQSHVVSNHTIPGGNGSTAK
ncbi:hypothetical protein KP509_02G019300 [Ceratopteris richardii]|uniref:Protein EARLY FLOWERING 4 domain-containing protein n=1 Tax=Ceratopteris richardii TaxID=49495 RepID=A0A8T2VBS3_CERRI|nr:hypothetical protein KP509_02G019300 [Ceratopteris richardii]